MRYELNDDNKVVTTGLAGSGNEEVSNNHDRVNQYENIHDEIKDQRLKFREMDFKNKVGYILDYYKWYILGAIVLVLAANALIKDVSQNRKPTYINVVILDSFLGFNQFNPLEQDYINQYDIDLNEYKLLIDTSMALSDNTDVTTLAANQQKMVAMYVGQEVDVAIGPVSSMEKSVTAECFADLGKILPKDLIDQLTDRDYEFYYIDPQKDRNEFDDEPDEADEVKEPYFAGVYLDNCSYLNNLGEFGSFATAEKQSDRPIFTIATNTERMDKAIEFLRFLIENH